MTWGGMPEARETGEAVKADRREWTHSVFGGAGVSAESGIPVFRGVDGLYSQKYGYPSKTISSRPFFMKHTEEICRFHRDRMLCLDAQPNACHRRILQQEAEGRPSAVVTRNIDGLHQAAGSKKVYELHSGIHRNHCTALAIEDGPMPRGIAGHDDISEFDGFVDDWQAQSGREIMDEKQTPPDEG